MKTLFHSLKKFLLPHACIVCGYHTNTSQDLCLDCKNNLFIPSTFNENEFALYSYQRPLTHLIMNLKFQESLANARVLGELLAEKISNEWYQTRCLPEAIIPMPLHKKRLKQRGFNQALEIARPLSSLLKIPIDNHLVQRVKYTSAQATLAASKREENIKNAFHVTRHFAYQHVAVLDDVITTGKTMETLCHALRQSGINHIDKWCCARAV